MATVAAFASLAVAEIDCHRQKKVISQQFPVAS
jgi:hypothetical protein